MRTIGPHAHRGAASRPEPLGNQAGEQEFPAPDRGQTHVTEVARTPDQPNVRPGAREQRDGNGPLPGRDPTRDPVHDPAKDQHPHPVPRAPGKAVIHLSGNDRNLDSDPAADRRVGREGTGQGMQFRAALPVAGPKIVQKSVVQKGVARKDCRLPEATVPGWPSDPPLRVVLRVGLQFPFALARTVLTRHKVQRPVLEEVPAAAAALTGRVLGAMRNLADDPEQTQDRSGAAKARVRRLTPAHGPPSPGPEPARQPEGPAVNLAGSQVGNQASHPPASGAANQAGKSQEHDD
jgi:hypothetical protein